MLIRFDIDMLKRIATPLEVQHVGYPVNLLSIRGFVFFCEQIKRRDPLRSLPFNSTVVFPSFLFVPIGSHSSDPVRSLTYEFLNPFKYKPANPPTKRQQDS